MKTVEDTTSLICLVDLEYIPDGLDAAELEKYLREHGAAASARKSYRETDSDIAAYRGLSNGAQEVGIGMAEVVSGSATFRPNEPGPVRS